MPPKKKTAAADAAAAELEGAAIEFDYLGEHFTISRDTLKRAGVVAGIRTNDSVMIVEGLLGDELRPWIRRHIDEDAAELFSGFLDAFGEAIAVPNSEA